MRDVWLLASLEARRTAPWPLVVILCMVTAAAALLGDVRATEPVLAGLAELDRGAAVAASATRASALAVGFALAGLALLVHGAGLAQRWRQGDGDWLGARPIGQTRAFGACLGGAAVGALTLVAAVVGTTATLAAVGALPASEVRPLMAHGGPQRHVLLQPGTSLRHELPEVEWTSASLVRVRVQNTADSLPFGDVLFTVAAGAGAGVELGSGDVEVLARKAERVARRALLELPLARADPHPDARAADRTSDTDARTRRGLTIEIAATGLGAIAVVAPFAIEVFGAPAAAWRVELALAARFLALVVAGIVLAAAFGAWVAPALAVFGVAAYGVLVLVLVPEFWPARGATFATIVPGSGLEAAFSAAAAGDLPQWPSGHQWLGLAFLGCCALGLGRAALGSWRHAS